MTTARPMTIVLPGGAGYLGRCLGDYFVGQGHRVIVLSRGEAKQTGGVEQVHWDGRTLGAWAGVVDGADAVVNLAGRSVNCRYTARHRQEIYDSRRESTRVLGEAIARARRPPAVWINSSSATVYRHALDRPQDEERGELGSDFSPDVVKEWEKELAAASTPQTRKVALRSAMVFGPGQGGVFEAFYRIVRLGLGGTLGPGTQMVSWVHDQDFCRAVGWVVDHGELDGAVNVASPKALPNRAFMQILRKACGRRIGLPATRGMLEIGAFFLRTETELLLKSRWVVPQRLLSTGFSFQFPDFESAALQIVGRHRAVAGGSGKIEPSAGGERL